MNNVSKNGFILRACCLVAVFTFTAPVLAGDFLQRWFQNRLFTPTEQQRDLERKGQVVIYDGMFDVEVNRAMDTQFERIQHMMFIGTIVTDQQGNPKRDTRTGYLIKEDDDC